MAKKTKTRVLFIEGDDYAALTVEQEIGIEKAAKMVEDGEEFPEGIECSILEFGAVDPKFITWLRRSLMIDYDHAKTMNFYVL